MTVRALGINETAARIVFTGNGIGVNDGTVGVQVPDQINRTPNGKSEALIFDFGAKWMISMKITVSNLIPGEGGGERGKWEAFDERGQKISEGIFGPEIVKQASGVGEFVVEDIGRIHSIVFTGAPYVNGDGASASDSSDYFVRSIAGRTYSQP